MQDELDAPLGKKDAKTGLKQKVLGLVWSLIGTVVAIVKHLGTKRSLFHVLHFSIFSMIAFFVIASVWVVVVDDPTGGQPGARSDITYAIEKNSFANQLRLSDPAQRGSNTEQDPASDGGILLDQFEVELSETEAPPVGDQDSLTYSVSDLLEETQHGAVPQINDFGLRAFDRYARAPSGTTGFEEGSRIAIIVTGLGLSSKGTRQAIVKLPADVTLAFAPYGPNLENNVRLARERGHEILLQIPMEPYDYPNSDPGPKTLLTGASARSNIDRLHWFMSRFGAYVGVINYMGARFTASQNDLNPLMQELSLRGIGYVDDGSSTRSLADKIALNNEVPFAQIDANLDQQPVKQNILDQLEALEKVAQTKGQAIGQISALPISIKTVTDWAKSLSNKNIILVPVTALARR